MRKSKQNKTNQKRKEMGEGDKVEGRMLIPSPKVESKKQIKREKYTYFDFLIAYHKCTKKIIYIKP